MNPRFVTNVKPGELRERFARLLDDFSTLAPSGQLSHDPREHRRRALAERFGEVSERAEAAARAQAATDAKCMDALLDGYRKAETRCREQQEQCADDFNLLDVMRLTGKEIRHSMVLAWVLDHDLRRLGTHAQGKLGFRLFLEEFRLPLRYADCNYWVRREVAGDESVVDIEVACRNQFLIHIENKIRFGEGADQTDREWSDVRRRAAGLGLNLDLSDAPLHALFLTPDGTNPSNANFRPVSWGRVARVFETFADQAKPHDVRLFARHYARTLRRFIASDDRSEAEYDQKLVE